ncbi:hypothetical protein BH10BAC3_BH10BAC3_39880 [soil metagenome]
MPYCNWQVSFNGYHFPFGKVIKKMSVLLINLYLPTENHNWEVINPVLTMPVPYTNFVFVPFNHKTLAV